MKNFNLDFKIIRTRIIYFLLTLFLVSNLYAQQSTPDTNLPEVIPPSPTVANLMQFEEVPVSHYTGQPNISIPLYSKALNNELGINLALNYNTQGVKINSRSGWTGTSWSLFAGGTVSRTVRGIPDESTLNTAKGVLHLDDYWNYETINLEDKKRFNWRAVGSSTNKNDTDVDLYQFNFLNYSGRFVILKEGNTIVPKLISKNHNFKIEFIHNSYVINSFIITDAYGYKYTFDIVENMTSSPLTASTPQGGEPSIPSSGASASYVVNSAWHLSTIKTSNNIVLASFNYTDSPENYMVSVNRTYNDIIDINNATLQQLLSNPYSTSQLKPEATYSFFSTSGLTKKLSSIIIRDQVKVSFNLSSTIHPETGGELLDDIIIEDITDINNPIENKTFKFHYDITTYDVNDPESDRLWLTKVTETANGISHDYVLNYLKRHLLPGFDSGVDDAWGYYSGIGSTKLACGQTFNENQIKTGLLTDIIYPTGGVKEFEFEHNSYAFFGNQPIGFDHLMENPFNSTIQSKDSTFSHQNANISLLPLLVDTISLGFTQDIYITSHLTNGTTGTTNQLSNYRLELTKNGVSYSGLMKLDESCHIVHDVPAGTYELSLRLGGPGGDITSDSFVIEGTTGIDYKLMNPNPVSEMIGGGIRIKEIIFRNEPSSNDIARKVTYDYNQTNVGPITGQLPSSGVIDSKADRLKRNYTHNVTKMLFSTPENLPESFLSRIVLYSIREEGVNVELSQGSYVGYRNVRVSEENNGYTTYSFTSPYDYPSLASSFSLPNATPRENLDYKRGLLLEQKVYDNSTTPRILKKVSNLDVNGLPNYFDDDSDVLFKSRYAYKEDSCPFMQFYDLYEEFRDTTPSLVPLCLGGPCIYNTSITNCGGAIPQLNIDFIAGWAKLLGTTTTNYFYDNQNTQSSIEMKQEFEYNDDNFQVKEQKVTYNKGGVVEESLSKMYYPVSNIVPGYNDNVMQQRLVDLNKINSVIATEQFKNGVKLSQVNTYYHEVFTDLILPKEIKVGKSNDIPEPRVEYVRYDLYGNPLEVKKEEGISISYIWGYQSMYPVAKLINVSFSEIELLLGANFNAGTGNLTTSQIAILNTNLPNAQMSFYEYDPMVGITKMTDTRGYFMTYHYDEFNRLEHVKDKDGNILSENEYNYKNQY